jgi:uncharacterized protein (TIGR02246 family)
VRRAGRFLALVAGALMLCAPAFAGTREEVLDVYGAFAEAQNARDLDRIGAFFIDGPDFLWVSDGQSFWGRPAVLERMSGFQKAAVWHVVPDLEHARVVELGEGIAMLHMPLVLEIGSTAAPDHLRFLVSILFREEGDGWRIAALLTTTQKGVAP